MRQKHKARRLTRQNRERGFGKPTYYYLYAKRGDDGNPLISGPYNSAREANSIAYSNDVEEFDVIPLKTRNQAEATRQIKAKRLNEGVSLEYASEKFKHDWNKIKEWD